MIKKIAHLSVFILAIFSVNQVAAQRWQWANSYWSSSYEEVRSVATDAHGNTYMTGFYSGDSMGFGSSYLRNTTYHKDNFLVKTSPGGTVLWVKGAIGRYDDFGQSVAVDRAGNVYVAGNFSCDTITFGTTAIPNTHDVWGSYHMHNEIFICKYDPSGNLVWAKKAGGGNGYYQTVVNSMTSDTSGNIYATGYSYGDTVHFGSLYLLGVSGSCQNFLVKYDTAGNAIWARGTNSGALQESKTVKTDASGNIYIAGYFTDTTLHIGSYTLTNDSAGTQDIFIASYSPSGTVLWASSFGGRRDEIGVALAIDKQNNIYLGGNFRSYYVNFGAYTVTNTEVPPYGTFTDVFLAKFNTSGAIIWAKWAGGRYSNDLYDIVTDTAGSVYISGNYYGLDSMSFGSAVGLYPFSGGGGFMCKYSPAGNALWVKGVGIEGMCMAIDTANAAYLAGTHGGAISFDTLILSSPYSTGFDIFLAKIADTCAPLSIAPITGPSSVCVGGSSITLANATVGGFWSVATGNASITSAGVVTGLSGGADTVFYYYTNRCGYAGVVSKPIAVNVFPPSGTISGKDSVCQYDSITLMASVPGGTWSSSSGNAIVNSAGVVTAVSGGGAIISYTVTNGCGPTVITKPITTIWATLCPTGITDANVVNSMHIYPNPSQGLFTIQLPITNNDVDILLSDLLGNVVKHVSAEKYKSATISFDAGELASGNYIFKVTAGDIVYREKVTIME